MHFADHRDGGAMVDMVLGEDTPGYRARGGPLGVPLAWVSLLPRRRVEASFFVRPVSTQRSLRYRRRTDVQRLEKKKKLLVLPLAENSDANTASQTCSSKTNL